MLIVVESSHTLTVGSFFWYCGETYLNNTVKYPYGSLVCNGAAISRTEYPELFEKIGTVYGAGDGSTTFNVPNVATRFIQGNWNSGPGHMDLGIQNQPGLPNITGGTIAFVDGGGLESVEPANSAIKLSTPFKWGHLGHNNTDRPADSWSVNATFDASQCNSIYGRSTTVQPRSICLCPCIIAFSTSIVTYCFKRTV